MPSHGRFPLCRALAPAALLLACGCTLTPLVKPGAAPVRPAATQPGTAVPAGAAPAPAQTGGVAAAGASAPILPLNLTPAESPQDAISLLSQRLAANDDDRKVLAARLAQVETTLQEREKALDDAREVIGNADTEVTRSRAEIKRLRSQVDDMRDKLRGAEKDKKELLEKTEKALELLERCEKERAATPAPAPDADKSP